MEQKKTGANEAGPAAAAWLVELIESGELRPCRSLVTAADMVDESLALSARGFRTLVVDTSKEALSRHRRAAQLRNLEPTLIRADLFGCKPSLFGPVELIWERTLFHRLPPSERADWIHKTARILPKGGRMLGWFQVGRSPDGPPYAVNLEALENLVNRHFVIEQLASVGEAVPGESRTYRAVLRRK